MKINLTLKRNGNGYRKVLLIDTDRKEYALDAASWFTREDYIECNASDMKRTRDRLESEGYKRVDFI